MIIIKKVYFFLKFFLRFFWFGFIFLIFFINFRISFRFLIFLVFIWIFRFFICLVLIVKGGFIIMVFIFFFLVFFCWLMRKFWFFFLEIIFVDIRSFFVGAGWEGCVYFVFCVVGIGVCMFLKVFGKVILVGNFSFLLLLSIIMIDGEALKIFVFFEMFIFKFFDLWLFEVLKACFSFCR